MPLHKHVGVLAACGVPLDLYNTREEIHVMVRTAYQDATTARVI
ncbi:hypothetical protein [Bradyrhizobium arachidis]|nr:hypothetical protein [Bradyrhizobium arachidis]